MRQQRINVNDIVKMLQGVQGCELDRFSLVGVKERQNPASTTRWTEFAHDLQHGDSRRNRSLGLDCQTKGPLLGDSLARQLQSQLLSTVSFLTSASTLQDPTAVGLTINRDGTVAFDRSKFLTAYAADLAVSLAAKQIKVDATTDQMLVRNFADELSATSNGSGPKSNDGGR